MHLYEPGTPEYADTTTLNNAMIERRPALVARCASPADVADAIAYARREGLPLAVRAGGHSVAGLSLVDDGLVIDVRDMASIEVDRRAPDRARRRRRDVVAVRPRDPAVRPRHHRRPRVDHRRGRAHARRRLRLARAQARAGLRQPAGGRARDRRRRARARLRGRASRPVLGAARRRRQLRRGHRVRVPAAPARARGLRRPRAVPRRPRARAAGALPRRHARRAARGSAWPSCTCKRAGRGGHPRAPARRAGGRDRRHVRRAARRGPRGAARDPRGRRAWSTSSSRCRTRTSSA